MQPIIPIEEAREILGAKGEKMSDIEIAYLIETTDHMAEFALKQARKELIAKQDANKLADLIYDVYKEKK